MTPVFLLIFFLETERQLRTNDHEFNSTFQYVNNYIRTSKYTLLSFVPQNLFEQFQRVANLYFLLQIVIMVGCHGLTSPLLYYLEISSFYNDYNSVLVGTEN